MLDEETHKKEIVRMWDTLRGDEFKGQNTCHGVACKDCPFNVKDKNENKACLFDTIFNIIENWSEEHPQEYKASQLKKYKVSKFEYEYLKTFNDNFSLRAQTPYDASREGIARFFAFPGCRHLQEPF